MKICDLHTHSTYSDGTFTPKEIIDSALNIGLAAVALCDHNTVDGLSDFLSAAEGKNIEAIPGVEVSVDYNGTELHLLGLYIPEKRFDEVSKLLEDVNERKKQSNIALVESLNQAGYKINYEDISRETPNGMFNRAHVAKELIRKGYETSIEQALATVLAPEEGHYKAPQRLSFLEMVEYFYCRDDETLDKPLKILL